MYKIKTLATLLLLVLAQNFAQAQSVTQVYEPAADGYQYRRFYQGNTLSFPNIMAESAVGFWDYSALNVLPSDSIQALRWQNAAGSPYAGNFSGAQWVTRFPNQALEAFTGSFYGKYAEQNLANTFVSQDATGFYVEGYQLNSASPIFQPPNTVTILADGPIYPTDAAQPYNVTRELAFPLPLDATTPDDVRTYRQVWTGNYNTNPGPVYSMRVIRNFTKKFHVENVGTLRTPLLPQGIDNVIRLRVETVEVDSIYYYNSPTDVYAADSEARSFKTYSLHFFDGNAGANNGKEIFAIFSNALTSANPNAAFTSVSRVYELYDARPQVRFDEAEISYNEGDGVVLLPVRLSFPAPEALTVGYDFAGATQNAAVLGADLDLPPVVAPATQRELTFAPGETVQYIAITLNDDNTAEPTKAFTLTLSSVLPTNIADIGVQSQIQVNIIDNDRIRVSFKPAPGQTGMLAQELTGINNVVKITLALNEQAPVALGVEITLDESSYVQGKIDPARNATLNKDFLLPNSPKFTVVFPPNTTEQTFDVVINDDTELEPEEYFKLSITALSNTDQFAIGYSDTLRVFIDDDDFVPQVGFYKNTDCTLPQNLIATTENTGQAGNFVHIPVTLCRKNYSTSPYNQQTVIVNYITEDMTALAGIDYQPAADSLIFAPGVNQRWARVKVINRTHLDPLQERTFAVVLKDDIQGEASLGSGNRVLITIIEDDLIDNRNDGLQARFEAYPNPVADLLNIKNLNAARVNKIEIFNTLGETLVSVAEPRFENNVCNLNLSSLSRGVYLLRVSTAQGVRQMKISK